MPPYQYKMLVVPLCLISAYLKASRAIKVIPELKEVLVLKGLEGLVVRPARLVKMRP